MEKSKKLNPIFLVKIADQISEKILGIFDRNIIWKIGHNFLRTKNLARNRVMSYFSDLEKIVGLDILTKKRKGVGQVKMHQP